MAHLLDQVIKPSSQCYTACTENCIRQCSDSADERYDLITGSEYAPRVHEEPIPMTLPQKGKQMTEMVENANLLEGNHSAPSVQSLKSQPKGL